jgi:hypothetical protein
MTKCYSVILAAMILVAFSAVSAQDQWHWTRNDDLLNPTGINASGGNSPYLYDIDNDGDKDLIIGELGKIELYYNDGFPANQHWRIDTTYFAGLQFAYCVTPAIGDFDLDGQVELVVSQKESMQGYPTDSLRAYRNIGTPQLPQWSEISGFFNFSTAGYTYQKFVDWDGDGDFDLILACWQGGDPGFVYRFYRNIGSPGQPDWSFDSTISIEFPFFIYAKAGFDIADLNSDGNNDIIIAAFNGIIVLCLNQGTNENPSFFSIEYIYSYSGKNSSISIADLDNDSDYDFIVGGYNSTLSYYSNLGSAQDPVFNNFPMRFGPTYIEGGEDLALFDKDGDLDYDIAMSYKERYYPNPESLIILRPFDNIGNITNPVFQPAGWLPELTSHRASFFMTAGDIAWDERIDITASWGGRLIWFYRISNGLFDWDDRPYYYLNQTGNFDYPELVDLNSDGLLDLIVRDSATAQLIAFKNIDTSSFPSWELNTQFLAGLDLSSIRVRAADLNHDILPDLVALTDQYGLAGYLNVGTSINPAFQYDLSIFGDLQNQLFYYFDLADLDGDGDEEILLDDNGQFILFENQSTLGIDENAPLPNREFLCQTYPNPFNAQTTISFSLLQKENVKVSVFDIAGRLVENIADKEFPAGENRVIWNAIRKPSGVYFVQAKIDNSQSTRKLLLLK